jgi:hypothetical protein
VSWEFLMSEVERKHGRKNGVRGRRFSVVNSDLR